MNVGILTYYGVFNHGAVLQANALKTVIKSMGHNCDFIQFNRNYDMIPQAQVKKYNISVKSVFLYAQYLKKKGIKNTVYNLKKNSVLKRYRQSNLPLGSRYTDFTGDAVVIGSDEVFSLEIGINPFFYGHGLTAKRVISYAGCFGPTTLEDVRKLGWDAMIASGLKRMNAISTRDLNSAKIVEELTGKKPEIVCDPVILYGYKKEMLEYIPADSSYVVIYSYENNMNNPDEIQYIQDYAKKNGLKVYAVAYYHDWCEKNIQATPYELLGWIKNAALVVTDTFHGAVLSLVCNTPMVVKLRGNQNKLAYLMGEYNLDNRILDDISQLESVAGQQIDFCAVNAIIDARRSAAMDYLEKALSE